MEAFDLGEQLLQDCTGSSLDKKSFNKNINNKYIKSFEGEDKLLSRDNRENDLAFIARCLKKGGMANQDDIKQVLEMLALSCDPDFPLTQIENIAADADNKQDRQEIDLVTEVERFISVSEGAFSVSDVCQTISNAFQSSQSVSSVSNRFRNRVRLILHRLKQKGKIKPYGKKDGWYVRVDSQAETIEWWDADPTPMDIKMPFGEERLVHIYPKNIILLAGEPNKGKTGYCLNFAKLNMAKHRILYCSSEMGAVELKTRLSKFKDVPLDKWRQVKFVERSSNFADIIEPDAINCVDFLEITDNFYLVADYTKQIYEKLNKGIALICIQKDSNKTYGRGNELGLEKPRLYLSMGGGKLKILKAKAWVNPQINPNGLTVEYKLVNGCEFHITKTWGKA